MRKNILLIILILFESRIAYSQDTNNNEIRYDSTQNYVDIKNIDILIGQTILFENKSGYLEMSFFTNIERDKKNINYNKKYNDEIVYCPKDEYISFTDMNCIYKNSFLIISTDYDYYRRKYLKLKNNMNGDILFYKYPNDLYSYKNVPFIISGYKEKKKWEEYKKRKYILDTLSIRKYTKQNIDSSNIIFNKYIELNCIYYDLNNNILKLNNDELCFTIDKDSAISLSLTNTNEMSYLKEKQIKEEQIKEKLDRFCSKIRIGTTLYAIGTYYDRHGYNIIDSVINVTKIIDINTRFKLIDVDIKGEYYYYLVFTLKDDNGILYKKEFPENQFYKHFGEIDLKKSFPKITKEKWKLINLSEVKLGMTTLECFLSWGLPKEENITEIVGAKHEQHVYDRGYLYFTNGILTAIQESY